MDHTLIVIHTKWFEPKRKPTVKVFRTPLVDGRLINLNIGIDLRTVDRVMIQPLRRPLMDVMGHLRDAEKLANEKE